MFGSPRPNPGRSLSDSLASVAVLVPQRERESPNTHSDAQSHAPAARLHASPGPGGHARRRNSQPGLARCLPLTLLSAHQFVAMPRSLPSPITSPSFPLLLKSVGPPSTHPRVDAGPTTHGSIGRRLSSGLAARTRNIWFTRVHQKSACFLIPLDLDRCSSRKMTPSDRAAK
jgi:hypothetical protein